MSTPIENNTEGLQEILQQVKNLPEASASGNDDSFRRWNVTASGAITSNHVNILQDDWLKQHRTDTNLCVALIPKFAIQHTSGKGNQGIYVTTNSVLMEDAGGVQLKSMSAFLHSNGGTVARIRRYGLTEPNDIGDMGITSEGVLRVVSYEGYPLIPGEYCVIACLM